VSEGTGWKRGRVSLTLLNGTENVSAHILDGVLAVHRLRAGGWGMTHVQTGYSIPGAWAGTKDEAMETAERLLPLAPWSRITPAGPSKAAVKRIRMALGLWKQQPAAGTERT